MAHAYTCNRQHLVFSTLERRDLIREDLQPRLWSYMAGVAKNHGLQAMAIGGIANHVHLLVSLPSDWSNAKAVQVIKANSSRWMREQGVRGFAWQRGHGGFSVSVSATAAVVRYIQNQAEHHHKRSFEDEFRALLRRHGIAIDRDLFA